jgi:hypothetical protein
VLGGGFIVSAVSAADAKSVPAPQAEAFRTAVRA